MLLSWLLAAAAAALANPPQAQLPQDIFVRDQVLTRQPTLARLSTDLLLGRPRAAERLERALRSGTGQGDDRIDGYLLLCGAYFREQRYADGVRVCSLADALKKGSAGNMIDLNRALSSAGPARWSRPSVRISLRDGQATTIRATSGATIETLIDTGAEIGILSRSAAVLLAARPLDAPVQVGTTTTPIAGNIVRVERLAIGNGELLGLTAVVIPDEQAKIMGAGLVIPFPALLPQGRIAYLDHGRILALGAAAPPSGRSQTALYWDESGVGFAARFTGGMRAVHFDSGSQRTYLFPAASGALSPTERATGQARRRTIAGLGGERVEDAQLFRNITVGVGGRPWHFPEIEMAEKDENGESARIGTGLFKRFRTVVLDFSRMQMSVADR